MGLNVLFIIILASMSLGIIIGVIMARPRRWDAYVCADDTAHAVPAESARDRAA